MHAFSKICIDHLRIIRSLHTIYEPSARHLIFKYRTSKTQKFFFSSLSRAAYEFSNFCRTLLTVNIPMADKEKRLQMKTIEETFKAEKKILEDFFKNKINFKEVIDSLIFYSVKIFKYNEDIRDFIRISIKGFLLYLDSLRRINGYRLSYVEVHGKETISLEYFHMLRFKYSPILRLEESVVGTNDFLDQLDNEIYNAEKEEGRLWGVEPFNIVICIHRQNINRINNEKVIKIDKIFKTEECVICLSTKPNVLFCSCGHLCICNECNKIKKLNVCPACRTENTILRIIE